MSLPPIELRAGELRLALRPDLGGSIAGLWLGGPQGEQPVLRSTEAADAGVVARWRAATRWRRTPTAWATGASAGWARTTPRRPISTTTRTRCTAWPGSGRGRCCRRRATTRSSCATSTRPTRTGPSPSNCASATCSRRRRWRSHLAFTNRAAQPQPVGLGWHPYFPKRSRSRLHIELTDRWENDASGLPTRRVPQPGIDGDVAHLGFDHCFEGWRGAARMRDEKLSLRLTSSLPYLVVYTPETRALLLRRAGQPRQQRPAHGRPAGARPALAGRRSRPSTPG